MKNRNLGKLFICCIFLSSIWPGTSMAAHYTYYIGEHTNFSGCGGSNLNNITSQLASYLNSYGWSGTHFLEGNSWPQDYVEDNYAGGIDAWWGDSKNLSVYAGHGYTDPLYGYAFGTPHSGKCSVDIDAEMVMGENVGMGGNGNTSYIMALTSCTGHQPKASRVWLYGSDPVPAAYGVAQVLAFHDSPYIHDDEPKLFASDTRASTTRTNKNEWLNRMDNCGPWYYFCSNSPIVMSFGDTPTEASNIHNYANIWYSYTDPYIETPNHWYWTYRDNGSGPCY